MCPGAMPHPSDDVPCDRGCTSAVLVSFSVTQGLHRHVSDQTNCSSPKGLRRSDFKLLTPSSRGTFHRRGLAASGTTSLATRRLVACGTPCVLSLRPERCCTRAVKEKPEEAEESEGGESASKGIVEEHRKRGEEMKRTRSGGARTRAEKPLEDARPFTTPVLARTRRGDVHTLAPGAPGYTMSWRTGEDGHRDSLHGSSVLHLYLPNYPTDPRKGADEVVEVETGGNDGETEQKTDRIQQLGAKCEASGEKGPPDVLDDVVTPETGSDQKKTEEDGEGRRSIQIEQTEKEECGQHAVREDTDDITREPSEERRTAEEEKRSGMSDGTRQRTTGALKERPKAPAMKLKSEAVHEPNIARRLILPSPALPTPGTLARTCFSLSPSVLPSFYGSLFGCRVRTPHTPKCHRSRTHLNESSGFDRRAIKSSTQIPPSFNRTGSRHVFKLESRGQTSPRPKITSCEWWGSVPRKTKTTKTFVWGPGGPQESKSVCELHTRIHRWRRAD